MKKPIITPQYISHSIIAMIGAVLVWRGLWRILDDVDVAFFGGDNFWFAVANVGIGILILLIYRKL